MFLVVNGTALSSGGALTILRQFIYYAALTEHKYVIFVPTEVVLDVYPNITYIKVDTKSWIKRIWWDCFGLSRYIKLHEIQCELCISLQNTSLNVDCQQLIYLHQSLPFSDVKYKLNRETIKYFLYKWFYKVFIFLFASKTTRFVVQTQWMKVALANCGVNECNILVFTPDIKLPESYIIDVTDAVETPTTELITFFYPASSLFYKNHLFILDALVLLQEKKLRKKAIFLVTFIIGDYPAFDDKVQKLGIGENISYLGVIPYENVIEHYISADAVLFPSYIETFGLPLAEAGVLGKKIICSDFPYSRDVLSDYQGVSFLDYQDASQWATEMASVMQRETVFKYPSLSFSHCATWKDFFNFI